MYTNITNIKKYAQAALLAATFAAVQAQAALPSYVGAAITDSKTQLEDLVALMVPAAIVLVLLALTPKVLLKMIRGLGSKVSF